MDIYGQLRQAQIEITDDVRTQAGSLTYSKTDDSIRVGNSSVQKKMFPLDVETLAQFRSAMFPIGSLIYNQMSLSDFEYEMGSGLWVNVADLETETLGAFTGWEKLDETTDYGIYLLSKGFTSDGSGHVYLKTPKGRYTRTSGTWDGVTRVNGEDVVSANVEHDHYYSETHSQQWDTTHTTTINPVSRTAYYDTYRAIGNEGWTTTTAYYDIPNGTTRTYTTGNRVKSGGAETAVESLVINTYLKVNR